MPEKSSKIVFGTRMYDSRQTFEQGQSLHRSHADDLKKMEMEGQTELH